jgi:type II secretory pathway pseudopilin PulG
MKLLNKFLCYNIDMKKGFTLIEAILYLAIAGTVLYFISGFAFNAIFGKAKIETVQEINQNSRAVLDEISRSVSDAIEINGTN